MKWVFASAVIATLSATGSVYGELPPSMKPTADEYDRAMKTYDDNIEAQLKNARDRYSAVLGVARQRAQSGKRDKQVAAIDSELAAVKAGNFAPKRSAELPPHLSTYRKQYTGAWERAHKAVASARRGARDRYLKWLDGMASAARVGKDAALEAAVAGEKKRVLADAAAEQKPAEKKPEPEDAEAGRK